MAGGGSLLTFPTLLALGYSPIVANVTNTVGVSSGNIGGIAGYRRELAGQRARLTYLGIPAAAGGLGGAVLLLRTPEAAFRAVVPALIVVAAVLVLAQPAVSARLRRRRGPESAPPPWAAAVGVGLTSVYGGYFGAAMGVMLIAGLGVLLPDTLQRTNALKTAITFVVNGLSAVVFALFGPVAWSAALTLAVATVAGGYLGAGLARRLPDAVLRAAMVTIGLVAAVVVAVR